MKLGLSLQVKFYFLGEALFCSYFVPGLYHVRRKPSNITNAPGFEVQRNIFTFIQHVSYILDA
jgi:hypothetical protein